MNFKDSSNAHFVATSFKLDRKREKARKKIVVLVFIVYWLLIFEGALRKWAFPSIHQVLFFIRDPFVLVIYLIALKYRFFGKSKILLLSAVLFVVLVLVGAYQVITSDLPVFVYFYGLRNYFFYVPLAFVIAICITPSDLEKLIRLNLRIAVPMAALVFIQFYSSPDSFINKGISSDGFVFRVTEDIVRTTGTFTFTLGQTYYVGSIFALLLYVWMLPPTERRYGKIALYGSSVATAVLVFLSGSRTVFFLAALTLISAWFSGILITRKSVKLRTLLIPSAFVLSAVIIFPLFFSDAFEAMIYRQQDAVAAEGSTVVRAFRSFTDFLNVFSSVPFTGYGIGYGTNGGGQYATGSIGFTLAEDEWTRIVMELGPVFGLLFISLRVALVLSLFDKSIHSARRLKNVLPLVLFGFIGIVTLNGGITMQGTVNGYGWIFAGFCMAATHYGKKMQYRPLHGRAQ